jgi:hypothetical protein
MRIHSSGAVTIGKTTTSTADAGFLVYSTGAIAPTRDGDSCIIANRLNSDGDIATFYKDGTTVGSIGSNNGVRLGIGTSNTGIKFWEGDGILPANPSSTFADRDNAIDLGYSSNRFKDLYLGGNIYLGGTGSANALDDYEEGTFTPLVEGTTTSGSATYTTQVAKYTKVGNIVHFNIFIRWQSGTGSGNLVITGLPFTSVGSSYHSAVTIGWMNIFDYTNGKIPRAYIGASASRVTFEESTDNGGSTTISYDSQAGLILSGSYETT